MVGIGVIGAVLLRAAVAQAGAVDLPPERTLTDDAVELVAGRVVAGVESLAVVHEGVAYWFATPESQAAFRRDPTRFEVADGGACARMGPLSGLGDARRYIVHEGRIYFFASDSCRDAFVNDPDRHIERDDAPPTGTPAQVEQGRAAMDRLVAWAGGADRWRDVRAVRFFGERQETQGERVWAVSREVVLAFPGGSATRDTWDDLWYTTVSTPAGGVKASRDSREELARARCRAFDRAMARSPARLIKAYVDSDAGLVVVGEGTATIDDAEVDIVAVALSGATSRLAIERSTGRPVQLAFRGRDRTATVGDSVRTFSAYRSADGVRLPTAYTVRMNGRDVPSVGSSFDALEINPALPPGLVVSGR